MWRMWRARRARRTDGGWCAQWARSAAASLKLPGPSKMASGDHPTSANHNHWIQRQNELQTYKLLPRAFSISVYMWLLVLCSGVSVYTTLLKMLYVCGWNKNLFKIINVPYFMLLWKAVSASPHCFWQELWLLAEQNIAATFHRRPADCTMYIVLWSFSKSACPSL